MYWCVQWIHHTSTIAGLLFNFPTRVIINMASKKRSQFGAQGLALLHNCSSQWLNVPVRHGLPTGWRSLCIAFRLIQDEEF